MRHAVSHDDLPPRALQRAVVEETQRHAVVDVGRAAPGVLVDVVHLAPARGNRASGNDARSVARDDRPPLGRAEDAAAEAEVDDLAPRVVHDALHRSAAGHLVGDRDRHCADAVDVGGATRGIVVSAHRDDQRGRRAADRGSVGGSRGDTERHGESIVLALRHRAVVVHGRLFIGSFRRVVGEAWPRRALRTVRIQHGVDERRQLPGHLGQELAAHRNKSVAPAHTDPQPAVAERALLGGCGTVLIEAVDEGVGERAQFPRVHRRMLRGRIGHGFAVLVEVVGTDAARGRGEDAIRQVHPRRVDTSRRRAQARGGGHDPGGRYGAVAHRRPHGRECAGQGLARGQGHLVRERRSRRGPHARLLLVAPGRAAQQVAHVRAAEPGGQLLVVTAGRGRLSLHGGGHDQCIDLAGHVAEHLQHAEKFAVGGGAGDQLVGGAGHERAEPILQIGQGVERFEHASIIEHTSDIARRPLTPSAAARRAPRRSPRRSPPAPEGGGSPPSRRSPEARPERPC